MISAHYRGYTDPHQWNWTALFRQSVIQQTSLTERPFRARPAGCVRGTNNKRGECG